MEIKEIAILAVFLIFTVPALFGIIIWSITSVNGPDNPENIKKGGELIAESAIPWWLGFFEAVASLPAGIAAILIIGFVFFLKWIGEIR